MPQAIVDPEELRRFAQLLAVSTLEINDLLSRIRNGLNRLGETWRDQEYQSFSSQLEQTLQVFNRFTQESDQFSEHLGRKAEPIEEYLGR